MRDNFIKLITNKIFIISSIIVLLVGAIVGVTFAWVGRSSEAELQATVSKILVDSDFKRIINTSSIQEIMPGDKISGEIYVQLEKASRNAFLRVKLSLDVDRSQMGAGFTLSEDQEKWLKEINFNLCTTYSETNKYRWSPYRGGYYYLLKYDSDLTQEKMLELTQEAGENTSYKLTDGVQIDFDSNMLFTDEHGDNIPFILSVETQAIQSEHLSIEQEGTTKEVNAIANNRILVGQLMNEVIGESVQESYIISFDSLGGTTIRSITVPFLDTSLSNNFEDQYNKGVEGTKQVYYTLSDLVLPQNPTKYGFAFDGWEYKFKGDNSANPWKIYNTSTPPKIYTDLEFRAKWKAGVPLRFRFARGEQSYGVVLQGDGFIASGEKFNLPYYVYNGMELVWFKQFDLTDSSVTNKSNYSEGGTEISITEDTTYYGAWYYIGRSFSITTTGRTRVATIIDVDYMKVFKQNDYVYDVPVAAYVDNIDLIKQSVDNIYEIDFKFYSIDIYKGFKAKVATVSDTLDPVKHGYKITFKSVSDTNGVLASDFIEGENPYNPAESVLLIGSEGDGVNTNGKYFTQNKQPKIGDHIYIDTDFSYSISSSGGVKTNKVTFTDEKGYKFTYSFVKGSTAGDANFPNSTSFNNNDINVLFYRNYNGEIGLKGVLTTPVTFASQTLDEVFNFSVDISKNMTLSYALPYVQSSQDKVKQHSYTGVGALANPTTGNDGALTISGGKVISYNDMFISILLPTSATQIGNGVFRDNTYIERLIIPDCYTSIGEYAFKGCSKLETIVISPAITVFAKGVFEGCSSLRSITIPELTESIGDSAFSGCYAIEEIYYFPSKQFNFSSGNMIFASVGKNTTGVEVYFGDNVKNIPNYFMYPSTSSTYTPRVVNVYCKPSLTLIGTKAFYGNTYLENLYIKTCDQLTSIGESSFEGCTKLGFADLPTGKGFDVGKNAFRGTTKLYSVKFGESVEIIGEGAYENSGITSINLPDSVITIGVKAFNNCANATLLSIGDGVETIQANAFANLYKCNYVFIDSDIKYNNSTGMFPYLGSTTTEDITFVIGNNVETIPDNLTKNNNIKIKNLVIGDKVVSIGAGAFYGCNYLVNLSLNSVVLSSIGAEAFSGCTTLKHIVIPESVTAIGVKAFYNCPSLETLEFNAKLCNDFSETSNVFYKAGHSSRKLEVTIGENVTALPTNLLRSDNLAYSPLVAQINYNAKKGTSARALSRDSAVFSLVKYDESLKTKVVFGVNVQNIPAYLFYSGVYKNGSNQLVYEEDIDNFSGLTRVSILIGEVVISDSVTTIEKYSFFGLDANELDVGYNVRVIEEYAFYGCVNVKTLALKDALREIKDYAFYNAKSVKQLTIGEGVRDIGIKAFANMNSLQRIYFNAMDCQTAANGNIFEYAGSQSAGGTSLVFGSRVQVVPQYLINSNTTRITVIQISNSVVKIGTKAFANCTNVRNVKMGGSVQTIEKDAFNSCGLTSVVLPSTLIEIGNNAFYNCFNLALIEFNAENCADFPVSNKIFERRVKESTTGYTAATLVIGSTVRKLPANFIEYTEVLDGTGRVHSAYINKVIINAVNLQDTNGVVSPLAGVGKDVLTGTTVSFSDSVVRVPALLFNKSNITSLYLGRSVTTIGAYAFNECLELKTVTFSQSITSFGDYAFNQCAKMRNTNAFPEFVTVIGRYAFRGCENLSIDLYLTGVKQVREYSFYGTGLKTLYVGKDVTLIEKAAFAECNYLSLVDFNAVSCSYVYMGTGADKVDPKVFACSSTLVNREVYVNESVTTLPDYFMAHSKNLTYAYFNPKNMDAVGMFSFLGCGVYVSEFRVEFGDNVTRIPDNMFAGTPTQSSGITKIDFTEKITTIGKNAFAYCSRLLTVDFTTAITQVLDRAFYSCSNLKRITITASIVNIGEEAFAYCTSAESITLGASLKTIGKRAFMHCDNVFLIAFNSIELQNFTPDSQVFAYVGSALGLGSGGTLQVDGSVLQIPEYFMSAYTGTYSSTSACAWTGCTSTCVAAQALAPNIRKIVIANGCSLISKFAFACNPNIFEANVPGSVVAMDRTAFYHLPNAAIQRSAEVTIKGKLMYSDGSDVNDGKPVMLTFNGQFMDFTRGASVYTATVSATLGGQTGTAVFLTSFDLYASPVLDANGYISVIVYRTGQITDNFVIPKQIPYIIGDSYGNPVEVAFNVVGIGDYGFYMTNVPKISMPEGIASIGTHAFDGCQKLASITFSSKTKSIGSYAFNNCIELTALYIPETIESVGGSAFAGLKKLVTLEIATNKIADGNNTTQMFTNMGCSTTTGTTVIFKSTVEKIPKYILYSSNIYNGTTGIKLNSVTIEGNVESISDYAFYGCGYFTSITIPSTVTRIEESAFESTTHLTTVDYGLGIEVIGRAAFKSGALDVINIPSTVNTVGEEAYMGNANAQRIVIPNTVANIGKNAFSDCVRVSEVSYNAGTIPAFAEGDSPFVNLAESISGAKVTFGSSVVSIPEGLFRSSNAKLLEVVFTGATSSIGSYAFESVTGLTTISLPGGMESVYSYAFYNCVDLVNLDLGSTVSYIGTCAFGFTSVNALTLPATISELEPMAFGEMTLVETLYYCVENFTGNFVTDVDTGETTYYQLFDSSFGIDSPTGLSVTIASNVISIPIYFIGTVGSCVSLTFEEADTANNKLEYIGDYAFYQTNINSVTLPYNLKTLSSCSFAEIAGLRQIIVESNYLSGFTTTSRIFENSGTNIDVIFTNKATRVPDYMFYAMTSVTSIQLGNSITSIGKAAFFGTTLFEVTIPENVVTIEPLAFANLPLATLNFNATALNNFKSAYYNVFYGSADGISVNIADNVTRIPDYFLSNMQVDTSTITSIEEYVEEILNMTDTGEYAFDYIMINELTIGSGVSSFGKSAFAYANPILQLNYNATNAVNLTMDTKTFKGTLIENLVFGNVSSIPAYLFYTPEATATDVYSISIRNITFSESITSIGAYAFTRVDMVTRVDYYITSLSEYVSADSPFIGFGGGSGKVVVHGNVTSLPRNFMRGASVVLVVFNYTYDTYIQSIGDYAFADNSFLSTAAFNSSTPPPNIGANVFGDPAVATNFSIAAPVSTRPEPINPDESEDPENPEEPEEPAEPTAFEKPLGPSEPTDPDDPGTTPTYPPGPYEISFPGYVVSYYEDDAFESTYLF